MHYTQAFFSTLAQPSSAWFSPRRIKKFVSKRVRRLRNFRRTPPAAMREERPSPIYIGESQPLLSPQAVAENLNGATMSEQTTDNPIKKIAIEPEKLTAAAQAAVAPKRVRRRRAWLFQAYVVAAAVGFGVLAISAYFIDYFPLDLQITLAIQSIDFRPFDVVMRLLTELGFSPQVNLFWGLTALFIYVVGLKWEAVMTVISVTGAGALITVVKLLVHRPRPGVEGVRILSALLDSSFPSGHVMFYVSLVGFLWFLCYTLLKPSWRRTFALWIFAVTVALAGPSRVYLGQHWASDVTGAYLLGSVWLAAMIFTYRWGKTRFFVTQPVAPETPVAQVAQPQATQAAKAQE